jgi:hypothetical protein
VHDRVSNLTKAIVDTICNGEGEFAFEEFDQAFAAAHWGRA